MVLPDHDRAICAERSPGCSPRELREGSLRLARRQRRDSIWSVILPYARVGITGAVLLSLGRALGETIAVTMVIGNTMQIKRFAVRLGIHPAEP